MPESNNGEADIVLMPNSQGPQMVAFKPMGERGPTVFRDVSGMNAQHVVKLNSIFPRSLTGGQLRLVSGNEARYMPEPLSAPRQWSPHTEPFVCKECAKSPLGYRQIKSPSREVQSLEDRRVLVSAGLNDKSSVAFLSDSVPWFVPQVVLPVVVEIPEGFMGDLKATLKELIKVLARMKNDENTIRSTGGDGDRELPRYDNDKDPALLAADNCAGQFQRSIFAERTLVFPLKRITICTYQIFDPPHLKPPFVETHLTYKKTGKVDPDTGKPIEEAVADPQPSALMREQASECESDAKDEQGAVNSKLKTDAAMESELQNAITKFGFPLNMIMDIINGLFQDAKCPEKCEKIVELLNWDIDYPAPPKKKVEGPKATIERKYSEPHEIYYGYIIDKNGDRIDQKVMVRDVTVSLVVGMVYYIFLTAAVRVSCRKSNK